jgi:hypothetical protein
MKPKAKAHEPLAPLTRWGWQSQLKNASGSCQRASLDQLISESMTTKVTDFKETMTAEIGRFIESQARAVSIADINRLIFDLPALHERFAQIPAQTYPNLAEQLQLLSLVVEEQVVRDPGGQLVGEAAFALLYS